MEQLNAIVSSLIQSMCNVIGDKINFTFTWSKSMTFT